MMFELFLCWYLLRHVWEFGAENYLGDFRSNEKVQQSGKISFYFQLDKVRLLFYFHELQKKILLQ